MEEAHQRTSVLVVDDEPGIRSGLRLLIDSEAPRLSTAGTAAHAAAALEMARRLQPALVVLDVNLGGEDGLALIAPMRRLAPCRVIVFTTAATPAVVQRALQLGAWACVSKTAPVDELLEALHAAAAPVNAAVGLSCRGGSEHPAAPGKKSDATRPRGT